ncbi:MAG: NAD(P)-dependent oxidoreductase [Actinobacteria bacterium]|nr:NAD(P)-dependent oxidoreductase [Actinomycetota bacterium]
MPDGARLCLVGLGNMGLPIGERFLSAGFRVTGYDVSAAARERAQAAGLGVRGSVTEAAEGADGVVLVLPNSDVVESVLRDPDVLAVLSPGMTVVDMSSSEPLRTQALAGELADRKVRLVDAPVSGGVKGARAGRLTIMAGGSSADLGRVTPWLEPLGRVVPTGKAGSGHAVKALNNLLSATHLLATSEAMLAGERLGVDPEVMLSVFNGSSGRSGSTESKFPNFILPRSFDSGFALQLMVKDLRIAVGVAEAAGAPHALAAATTQMWSEAAQRLGSGADHTEIDRWVRAGEADLPANGPASS